MITRKNLLLALSISSLPFLTGCLATPMNGTVQVRSTYTTPQTSFAHAAPPPMYAPKMVVHHSRPVISMPAPTIAVQPPTVHVRAAAPSMPAPSMKMKFGGFFGGGPKMKVKAGGAPKMNFKVKGGMPKMKVKVSKGKKKKWRK